MRKLIALSVLAVLIGASISSADLETPELVGNEMEIPGQAVRATLRRFKANEEALAIVSGGGATCLGLYVYDAQGNCVAKDDLTNAESSDDLNARWVPSAAAWYSVEVRNAGMNLNTYEFLMR